MGTAVMNGEMYVNKYMNFPVKIWNAYSLNVMDTAGNKFFQVATLASSGDTNNFSSLTIKGFMGSPNAAEQVSIDATIATRSSYVVTGTIFNAPSAARNYVDIVVYQEGDGTHTVYINSKTIYTMFELTIGGNGMGVSLTEPNNYITASPTGTLLTSSVIDLCSPVGYNSPIITASNNMYFNLDLGYFYFRHGSSNTVAMHHTNVQVNQPLRINTPGLTKIQCLNDETTRRHLVLWQTASNEHQFTGIGASNNSCRFQLNGLGSHWTWQSAEGNMSSIEVMRLNPQGTLTTPYLTSSSNGLYVTSGFPRKLQFANDETTLRHIVLWQSANNEHQFSGLGVQNNRFNFQLNGLGSHYSWNVAEGNVSSRQVMRLSAQGVLSINSSNLMLTDNAWLGLGTSAPTEKLHIHDGNILLEKTAAGLNTPNNYIVFKETGFNDRFALATSMGGFGADNKFYLTYASGANNQPVESNALMTVDANGYTYFKDALRVGAGIAIDSTFNLEFGRGEYKATGACFIYFSPTHLQINGGGLNMNRKVVNIADEVSTKYVNSYVMTTSNVIAKDAIFADGGITIRNSSHINSVYLKNIAVGGSLSQSKDVIWNHNLSIDPAFYIVTAMLEYNNPLDPTGHFTVMVKLKTSTYVQFNVRCLTASSFTGTYTPFLSAMLVQGTVM
jgi:hypothetical protein